MRPAIFLGFPAEMFDASYKEPRGERPRFSDAEITPRGPLPMGEARGEAVSLLPPRYPQSRPRRQPGLWGAS